MNGALGGLSLALAALLPPAPTPELAPTIALSSVDVRPTGLGGFVAYAHSPEGEVVGRRVEADAVITARADSIPNLDIVVDELMTAVLATDRATLRSQGLLRLTLAELGPAPAVDTPGGGRPPDAFSRDMRFHVLYEFLLQPTAPAGLIGQIPLDLEVGQGRAVTLIDTSFGANALDLFEVVDDPAAITAGPSDWTVNAPEERIEQHSRIRGGGTTATPNKPGTYLLLRTTPVRPVVRDFSLRAEFAAGDVGGMGVVFRYQDDNNFLFFLMDNRRDFRMLGKKVGGTFQAWDTPAVDATRSFAADQAVQVRVTMDGDSGQVFLDGELILQGRDASLAAAGQVGFIEPGLRSGILRSHQPQSLVATRHAGEGDLDGRDIYDSRAGHSRVRISASARRD